MSLFRTYHKPKKLTKLRISEVSLVDAGAGENCRVMFSKRLGDTELQPMNQTFETTFAKQYKKDKSMEKREENEESYPPINNERDLQAAVQAVGRARDPDKMRAYIRARARALGLTPARNDAFADAYDGTKSPVVSQRGLKSPIVNNKRNNTMNDELIQITKSHDVSDVVEIMKMNGVSDQMEFHEHLTAFAELTKQANETTSSAYARIFSNPENVELRKHYADVNAGYFPYEMRKAVAPSTGYYHAGVASGAPANVLSGEGKAVSQARRGVAEEDRLANRGGKQGRKPGQKQGKRFAKNFMKAALKSLNRGI